eukprot:COSAG01_NODE_19093_length_1031_cov_1.626609_2_plen_36_part_01
MPIILLKPTIIRLPRACHPDGYAQAFADVAPPVLPG